MTAIGADPLAQPRVYGWREYLSFYKETLLPRTMRTLGTATAAVAVVLGGWLTTVHAATHSLPGDPLYGLKLITEQAQLRLASLEERAILHTEFAERRLHEAVALQEQGVDPATNGVRDVFAALKQEMASASDNLQELQVSGNGAAAETASIVEARLGALDTVLDHTVAVSTSVEISTEVQQAKDVSREVQSTAVGVIVEDHEEAETKQSKRELSDMFMREYGNVQARQEFNLHRVEVLGNAIRLHAALFVDTELPSEDDLATMALAIADVGERIGDAMDNFAIGGYRSAFDTLHSLDGELLLMEARLAQAEITVTNVLSAATVSEDTGVQDEGSATP